MPRKVVLPKSVSKIIGRLGLERGSLIWLLTHLHGEMAMRVEKSTTPRHPDDDRCLVYQCALQEETRRVFTMVVDDTTSPEHFIIIDIYTAVE